MSWLFGRDKPRKVTTEGLWTKCETCREIVYRADVEKNATNARARSDGQLRTCYLQPPALSIRSGTTKVSQVVHATGTKGGFKPKCNRGLMFSALRLAC